MYCMYSRSWVSAACGWSSLSALHVRLYVHAPLLLKLLLRCSTQLCHSPLSYSTDINAFVPPQSIPCPLQGLLSIGSMLCPHYVCCAVTSCAGATCAAVRVSLSTLHCCQFGYWRWCRWRLITMRCWTEWGKFASCTHSRSEISRTFWFDCFDSKER